MWRSIENEQAMDIVMAHSNASEACVALIDESSKRWREAEGNYRDDITAIVCHLPFGHTRSRRKRKRDRYPRGRPATGIIAP